METEEDEEGEEEGRAPGHPSEHRGPNGRRRLVRTLLPEVPRSLVPGATCVLEALDGLDSEGMLPAAEVQKKAPAYALSLKWHTDRLSTLIGSSNDVPATFAAGESSDEGLSLAQAEDLWGTVLAEFSARAQLALLADPGLAGALEAIDKAGLTRRWVDDEDEEEENLGGRWGKAIAGLSKQVIARNAKILASMVMYINGKHILESRPSASAPKRASSPIPFPRTLAESPIAVKVNHVALAVFYLEFFGSTKSDGIVVGPLAHFLWATALEFSRDGPTAFKITGFKPTSTMARVANALLHVFQYTTLFFRVFQDASIPPDVSETHMAFHTARSSAFVASFRGRIQDFLGLERAESVILDREQSSRRGYGVVTVIHLKCEAKELSVLDVGAAVNSAHARASKILEKICIEMGCTQDEASTLSDPSRNCLRQLPAKGNIGEFEISGGSDRLRDCGALAALLDQAVQNDSSKVVLEEAVHQLEAVLLFLVYFVTLGTSRGPDLFNISPLSPKHPDAQQGLVDNERGLRHLYHSEAISSSNIHVRMGETKLASRHTPRKGNNEAPGLLHLPLSELVRVPHGQAGPCHRPRLDILVGGCAPDGVLPRN